MLADVNMGLPDNFAAYGVEIQIFRRFACQQEQARHPQGIDIAGVDWPHRHLFGRGEAKCADGEFCVSRLIRHIQ